MSETVIVGLLSLLGTLVGTLGGIVASNRLIAYRIEQLEKKVEKHNTLVERTYKLEGEMLEAQHDIKDIKGRLNHG